MELYDINRLPLIITPNEALLHWAIQENPALASEVDPEDPSDLSMVFLIPEFDDLDEAEDWLEENFLSILESLLEEWVPDDSNWPDNLAFNHLEKYADYSFGSVVIDTVDASYDE
ncbi:hypothetical protein [Lewinella sp. W8]|uniref:hypothetical protein n=1 Tax=Lewinella sp. W8 TaxID=2528208 RepID=UPI001067BEC0|nr:hypothetical protein [Lewinella sp. W8]MTB50188.1 hypothetical protein [Lewinella sp. W8]